MKHPFLLLFACLLFPLLLIAGESSVPANKHVKCTIEMKQKRMKAGSTSELLMKLQPVKGIHINLNPPISLTLDSSSILSRNGTLEIPKAKDFLDVTKPIRQSVTLSSAVQPGPQTLKGILTYYYCSDAEGWCSKFKQPVELTIEVVK